MRLTARRLPELVLVLGGIACAAVTLEVGTGFVRFDIPKEIGVHLLVVALAALALARRDLDVDRVDRGAGLFLLSLAPGLLSVVAPELAVRQGALTVALVALFVLARGAPRAAAMAAIGAAVVLAASGFLEAIGLASLSVEGFAPGGLTGQRNHLAHAAALGLALVFGTRARTRGVEVALALAATVLAGAIVVTRCRTGYVAAGAAVLVALPRLREDDGPRASLAGTLAGVALAAWTPLAISWTVAHPYLDSTTRMFELTSGSGAVRLEEARATLGLFGRHPWVGLGPGQWSSAFPAVAPAKAHALALADGSTPRLSHGDLLARAVEMGALGILGAAAWMSSSVRELRAKRGIGRAAPFAVALVLVELLDAGISVPSTGLVAALAAAALLPRAVRVPSKARAIAHPLAALASLAGIVVLVRVHAADRTFVESESTTALVAACEQDGAAATHCVAAARRALALGDGASAARAIAALERTYPAHPVIAGLQREVSGGDGDSQRRSASAAQ